MLKATPITGFIGAELTGVEIANGVDVETAAQLQQLLSQHHVIMLRDQHLTIAQQKSFTRIFGALSRLPYIAPLPEDSDVIAVLKEAHEHNTGVFGGEWHSDFSFLPNPPAGSVLNAIDIPEVGGDTVWANQVAAYRSLRPELKNFVDTHEVIHIGAPYGVTHAPPEDTHANASMKMTRGDPQADLEQRHPAVIATEDDEHNALFLNPIYSTRFAGLSDEESKPILDEIYRHCTRPDFCFRHRWRRGDVVVWNNRTTLHYATNDYDGTRRLLYRTTYKGKPPTRAGG